MSLEDLMIAKGNLDALETQLKEAETKHNNLLQEYKDEENADLKEDVEALTRKVLELT